MVLKNAYQRWTIVAALSAPRLLIQVETHSGQIDVLLRNTSQSEDVPRFTQLSSTREGGVDARNACRETRPHLGASADNLKTVIISL